MIQLIISTLCEQSAEKNKHNAKLKQPNKKITPEESVRTMAATKLRAGSKRGCAENQLLRATIMGGNEDSSS